MSIRGVAVVSGALGNDFSAGVFRFPRVDLRFNKPRTSSSSEEGRRSCGVLEPEARISESMRSEGS